MVCPVFIGGFALRLSRIVQQHCKPKLGNGGNAFDCGGGVIPDIVNMPLMVLGAVLHRRKLGHNKEDYIVKFTQDFACVFAAEQL